jgi:HK97 family phage major capsid protein
MNEMIATMRRRRDQLREEQAAVHAEMTKILDGGERRGGNLNAQEVRSFDRMKKQILALKDDEHAAEIRLDELVDDDQRTMRAAANRVEYGEVGEQRATPSGSGWSVGRESATYRPDEGSFFRDLVSARQGDFDAAQRLQRNNAEARAEKRALGNTGGTGGAGGEFSPPAWLESEFVALARAARVTADRLNKQPLPPGVSSVNLPKVLTGTTTAVQTTQNTAVSQTDPTTGALSSSITTIAGKVVVAQQLLDQSPIAFDRMILGDLAADYARTLDAQVIAGTGTAGQLLGLLNVPGITQIAYTQATPAVTGAGGLYATINKAISAVATTRFLPPTCIVMHPRRWSYIAAAFDSAGRPLVSPSGNAYNQIADAASVAAQGPVGEMAGLPVYVDPNLPINLGAGTNQDPILVLRAEDIWLWESDVTLASFDAPYSDSLGVLFRAHGYTAMIGGRYPASIAVVNGTGTVTPAY